MSIATPPDAPLLRQEPPALAARPPLRILLVSLYYLPFVGGVELHARQVAHEFRRRGNDVTVAAMNFAAAKSRPSLQILHPDLLAPTFDDYSDEGIPVRSLAPRSRLERLRLLPTAVRATPRLRRYAYDGLQSLGYPAYRAVVLPKLRALAKNADVIHSLTFGYLGWTAEAAARQAGVPFVCTPFVHPNQWGDSPNEVRLYQRSDAVIGLVDSDRDYLLSIGVPGKKAHVIGVSPDLPAGVDGAAFRERHGFDADTPLVLYVGRMTAHKGAAAILDAVEAVWKTAPQTHFVFIGPPSPEAANWFPPSGGDGRIHYLGKVSAQEKGDALAACDIFCMPSVSEILPTVYLEAWSLGKPVVGGMARGLPELVEGGGGGVCVSPEGAAVADALLDLLQNPDRRRQFGARGQALVAEKYSVTGVTNQLETLYRTLIAARNEE